MDAKQKHRDEEQLRRTQPIWNYPTPASPRRDKVELAAHNADTTAACEASQTSVQDLKAMALAALSNAFGRKDVDGAKTTALQALMTAAPQKPALDEVKYEELVKKDPQQQDDSSQTIGNSNSAEGIPAAESSSQSQGHQEQAPKIGIVKDTEQNKRQTFSNEAEGQHKTLQGGVSDVATDLTTPKTFIAKEIPEDSDDGA